MNKVGVVLLNWNSAKLTISCIESLISGTMKPDKIIVVDNASTDDSINEIAASFPGVWCIKNKANLGFSGGNNVGIRELVRSQYNYVWVLNNDTRVDPECLKIQYDFMENAPDVAGCCGKILHSDSRKTIWYAGARLNRFKLRVFPVGMLETDNGQHDLMQKTSFITGCSMFVRGSGWRRIGMFDEKFFAYCEDIDWCLRAEKQNFELRYLPKAVIYHEVSASFGKTKGKQTIWKIPPLVIYLSERNQLFLIKRWKNRFSLLVLYVLKIPRILYYSTGLLLLRKFDNFYALWKGTYDGLFNPGSEASIRQYVKDLSQVPAALGLNRIEVNQR